MARSKNPSFNNNNNSDPDGSNSSSAGGGGGGGENYRKSAEEWEILGELAERLHHFPEAIEAYQNCLRVRFSPKAMKGVLKLYEGQNKVHEMLQSLIRLIAWQYRWYSEVCPSVVSPCISCY